LDQGDLHDSIKRLLCYFRQFGSSFFQQSNFVAAAAVAPTSMPAMGTSKPCPAPTLPRP
jgi:hypothetical protein